MDILDYAHKTNPFIAEMQGREQEILNQQRVAQAQSMLEEARMKAEMQPYEIQSKQAAAAYNNAMAKKMLTEKAANPKHTADAQSQFQKILYPYIEAIQAEKDEGRRSAMKQQLIEQAREYNFPLDQFIDSPAFRTTMARSAEAAKLQGIDKRGAIDLNITDKRVEGAKDVARINAASRASVAASAANNSKTKLSYENAAVAHKEAAAEALEKGDIKSYEKHLAEYENFSKLALEKAAAPAVKGEEARTKGKEELLNTMTGGRSSSGRIGGGPSTGNDVETGAKKAWGAYEPDKYDYRVGPNGNLQRKPKGQ